MGNAALTMGQFAKQYSLHHSHICRWLQEKDKFSPKDYIQTGAIGKEVSDASNAKTHEKNVPARKKSHGCEYCDKQFSTKMELRSHEIFHSKTRRKNLVVIPIKKPVKPKP